MTEKHTDPGPESASKLFPCPCCGYFMFTESPGSFDICSICHWQDCKVQLAFPFDDSGPNRTCLYDSQRLFLRDGPDKEFLRRDHLDNYSRDSTWRPFDSATDPHLRSNEDELWLPEYSASGHYYWRDDYWLAPKNRNA